MSEHRRIRSQHRQASGNHRPLATTGRIGMLGVAVLTTVTIAVAGLVPSTLAEVSKAPSSKADRDRDREPGLADGLTSFLGVVREAAKPQRQRSKTALPKRSGNGRRAVFDMSRQRVWIVGRGDTVRSTYPVSGSTHDNLDPGTYQVYSRSRRAVGFDYQSTMQYFVRFAQGDNAAIGFHDIPVDDSGKRVQRFSQLGTPQSAGCIRQRRSDARTMWRFARIDTKVVVTR